MYRMLKCSALVNHQVYIIPTHFENERVYFANICLCTPPRLNPPISSADTDDADVCYLTSKLDLLIEFFQVPTHYVRTDGYLALLETIFLTSM